MKVRRLESEKVRRAKDGKEEGRRQKSGVRGQMSEVGYGNGPDQFWERFKSL